MRAELGARMRAGALLAAGGALGLWVGDVVVLRTLREAARTGRWLIGMGGALFVALTTALVAGALVAPLVAPAVLRLFDSAARFKVDLRERPVDASHALAAQALTFSTLVPLAALAAFEVSLAVPAEFARARSIAAVLTASHLGLAAVLWLTYPSALYLARAAVEMLARVPGPRAVLARAWRLPTLLAVIALSLAAALVRAHWAEVKTLPFRELEPLLGLLGGLLASAGILRSQHRSLRRGGLAVLGIGLVVSGLAATRIHPESTTARRLAFEEALSGRIGYVAWTAALDFDGDGQMAMLGGGDCAEFDARRHTGAIDIPRNGVDEDCDGFDQTVVPLRPRARLQVGQAALPRKPTIILITVDGLSARRLVALGGDRPLMPNVEALAASSALFTHAFSEGPSTRLSFPSMFTSRWDSQLRQEYSPTHPYPLAPNERQLQDVLDDVGYETIAVVPNTYFTPRRWVSVTRGFQRVDSSAVQSPKHNAPLVTDAALRILAEPATRPRYLWVHYFDAHGPYLPLPGVDYPLANEEAYYAAELSFIDQELGRLLPAIEAMTPPAYVLFTADHGSVFPLRPGHRHHYGDDLGTATLHVPLIVHGPGISPQRIDGLASTMDLFPTITDLLGIPDKLELEGESLWPEILASRGNPARTLFHEIYLGERDFQGHDPLEQVSVRDSTWNLTLDRRHGTYHLFDVTTDYEELRDLYEDQGLSPHGKRLRSLLGKFVGDFHRRAPGTAVLAPPPEER